MSKEINKELESILRRLDSLTYNHSIRVMMLASEVEDYLCMTEHTLMVAALFHDLGKLYIPFNILDKADRLSPLERELIDLHPYIGYKMLSGLGVCEEICRIVLCHHSFRPLTIQDVGYYDNDEMYNKAVILHTIDSFEALTSDRPYHRGLPPKEAIQILGREGYCDDKTLEYIKEMAYKEDAGISVVNRTNHDKSSCLTNLIMEMDLC